MYSKTTHSIPAAISSLLQPCSTGRKRCSAANLSPAKLGLGSAVKMGGTLTRAGFEKIDSECGSALHTGLDELILERSGMTAALVANDTRITGERHDGDPERPDWIAPCIGGPNPETRKLSGRATEEGLLPEEKYPEICKSIKRHRMRPKIDTVAIWGSPNGNMTGFIKRARPERRKIMQALPITGQSGRNAKRFERAREHFDACAKRSKDVSGITAEPEGNDLLTGSCAMVDPRDCFDSAWNRRTYDRPVLKVGIMGALQDVRIDPAKFDRRGGGYGRQKSRPPTPRWCNSAACIPTVPRLPLDWDPSRQRCSVVNESSNRTHSQGKHVRLFLLFTTYWCDPDEAGLPDAIRCPDHISDAGRCGNGE